MCIICLIPKGQYITEEEYDNGAVNNPDGTGYMFCLDNDIIIKKNMDPFELKDEFFDDLEKYGNHSNFVLHHRIGTHGNKDITNVHPFFANEDMAVCHNGVLDWYVPKNSEKSDTLEFVENVLSYLSFRELKNKGVKNMIYSILGYGKLVFMSKSGKVTIFNEKLGDWDRGRWFSNNTYRCTTEEYSWNEWLSDWFETKSVSKSISSPGLSVKKFEGADLFKCKYCQVMTDYTECIGPNMDICVFCADEIAVLLDEDNTDTKEIDYLINKYADLESHEYEAILKFLNSKHENYINNFLESKTERALIAQYGSV